MGMPELILLISVLACIAAWIRLVEIKPRRKHLMRGKLKVIQGGKSLTHRS